MALDSLKKMVKFGWEVREVNGNDIEELLKYLIKYLLKKENHQ
jgi:hypothetical protein